MDRELLAHHYAVWTAIDEIAGQVDMSRWSLAQHCGLDPTTFNPSKRVSVNGLPRWSSSETIATILITTGRSWAEWGIYLDQMKKMYVRPESKNQA
ncbi:hypothetical protein NGM99_05840 [Mesorhizobium sp. RP14(2022)]|uniref:DNA-binding protein n=1 Tax=Mesorhizobium liriopis TaxID=2953882 RepID=A0ABT1C517_9HYPH|nr:hypothetical protein [Mesorhizobium liriopis]MCO6049310.1 hypothetical protein [Mesorhizobium liriopis]